ncbi:hypothetical protein [Plasmodium yoelii yoelii]|uniref:Uncharacterized protein n=1 Tax=Plasmodium yoelii yoelii TaxID=73239 RepID=Q7RB74_PLAYO|nr:hypothetical protein [Plasmodium yoelii yoelii]
MINNYVYVMKMKRGYIAKRHGMFANKTEHAYPQQTNLIINVSVVIFFKAQIVK